jgi:hypothetical protein
VDDHRCACPTSLSAWRSDEGEGRSRFPFAEYGIWGRKREVRLSPEGFHQGAASIMCVL